MDAVSFAEPRALWLLGLALPLLALHLYRKRRVRLLVAFVPLVRESLGPVRPLGGWRRLSDAAPLVARLLALAALALALAGPRPASAAVRPVDLVVVLDADVTTTTVEPTGPGDGGGRTRFERGVTLAKALARAHGGGRVGLVVAGATPATPVAPGDDRDAFDRAAEAARPAPGPPTSARPSASREAPPRRGATSRSASCRRARCHRACPTT